MKGLVKGCLVVGTIGIAAPILSNVMVYAVIKQTLSSHEEQACEIAKQRIIDYNSTPKTARYFMYLGKIAAQGYLKDHPECDSLTAR